MGKIYRTNFSSPAALNDLARLKLDHETKYNRETEETSLRREFLISIVVIASINSDGFNVSFFFLYKKKELSYQSPRPVDVRRPSTTGWIA